MDQNPLQSLQDDVKNAKSMSKKHDFFAVRNTTYSKIYDVYVSDENSRLFVRRARAYNTNER